MHNSDERKRITCGVNDASALGVTNVFRELRYDINPTESLKISLVTADIPHLERSYDGKQKR